MKKNWIRFLVLLGLAIVVAYIIMKMENTTLEQTPSKQTIDYENSVNMKTKETDQGIGNSVENTDSEAVKSSASFMLNDHVQWRADYYAHGMFQQDMVLYQSEDGGDTWIKMGNSQEQGSTLPARGNHSGLFFLNRTTGWVTTSSPAEGDIGLYMTQDGGQTWTHQTPQVPMKFMREQFNTSLPFFTSSKFGIVVANNTSKNLLCYMTDNGGLDWYPIEQQLRGTYGDVKCEIYNSSSNGVSQWTFTYSDQTWTSVDGRAWIQ
ncbi:WD40/YVTN/BNR-like repeat-containing protein [Paenibacillus pini]|uniref:Photosynthesis system II assembly factor Ycf48/Hcf136-like domain-containing protein n=1 Tax=Paenibacillus pini JCM 16418 TaxID=1236976 RepID=W7YPH9_9BACL|nr:hypothetical protein [Paenibacillus pini]GAF10357.1 hypothetical protein JCM16418_4539 [Paenibacillus pini JCM 16418]